MKNDKLKTEVVYRFDPIDINIEEDLLNFTFPPKIKTSTKKIDINIVKTTKKKNGNNKSKLFE